VSIPRFPYYLFDVDGTLLDSAGDITAAVRHVFSVRGRGHHLTEEFLKGQIGRHLRGTFEEVFPEYAEPEIETLVLDYRKIYLAREHRSTSVFSGVAEALASLGGKKATATTKGSETTCKVLELFGLRRYIDHVQGTDGFPHKPAPDVLLRSMAALGAAPDETLMVGDSIVDVEAGKAAGVKTCVVRYGYGAGRIPENVPDYWVDDLRELLQPTTEPALVSGTVHNF
jgi:phosphoglycolate phosphatase